MTTVRSAINITPFHDIPMQTPATVYVVDDDDELRASISRLLRSAGLTSRTFASADEFLDAELDDMPACLLLDVRLPGTSGLELQERLNRLDIGLPIIIMTGHGDVQMSVKAMKAGAVDFLTKPFRDVTLLDAIDVALLRDRQRRERVQEIAELKKLHATLSPRESEVMLHVVVGKLNKQIASDLAISEATVKIHRAAIMRKMQATSLAELVRMAMALDLQPARSGEK